MLKILKKLLYPLPVRVCLSKGCDDAPNIFVPKTAVPKMWEKGTELYESLKDYDFSVGAYDEMQQKKKREE